MTKSMPITMLSYYLNRGMTNIGGGRRAATVDTLR